MKYLPTLTIIFTFNTIMGFGQCMNQVTHFMGNEIVNGIDVNVTSSGMVEYNDIYCTETFPYVAGFNVMNGNGDGSFTFAFSPSVNALTLNFGGISNLSGSSEMVSLDINGSHYVIPSEGTLNSCGPLAVLTPNGDIVACTSCNGSGWNETTIQGPISTLTVTNTVLSGSPNGSIFSLFICDPFLGVEENVVNSGYKIYPNPFTDYVILETSRELSNAKILVYNSLGQLVQELNNINGNNVTINRNNLTNGLYFLKLTQGGITLITDKLLIK